MQNVKVFLSRHFKIPRLKDRLNNYNISLYQETMNCDVAIILYGAYANPLAFKKRILAYWLQNDGKVYSLGFYSLYLPVLREYYDDLIDLTKCKDFEEIGDKIAKEVKRLENETP